MRVLIADRDESLMDVLRSYLCDRGHEAESATSGLECLAALTKHRPNAIVLDAEILWGGADGVLACLRDVRDLSDPRVVLVGDSPDVFRVPPGSTVDVWLKKPYRLSDLASALEAVPRRRAAGPCEH